VRQFSAGLLLLAAAAAPAQAGQVVVKARALVVPSFYVVNAKGHQELGRVVAELPSSPASTSEHVRVGRVSKQTPFGQGTGSGVKRVDLRPATPAEVLAAIRKNHPDGRFFRPVSNEPGDPVSTELMDIEFALALGKTFANPMKPSREELERRVAEIYRNHRAMLVGWSEITGEQIRAIRHQLVGSSLSPIPVLTPVRNFLGRLKNRAGIRAGELISSIPW
jgi:hypothetical protein